MQTYQIQDFIQIIAQLRNPNGGCPWDLKQTYQTMIPCLKEESYEVIDAIEKNDFDSLKEELGDLLLQVVFLSQLATEDNKFTFDDVVNEVATKIIRRHPHVFSDKNATNEQEALANWNQIKAQENQNKGHTSILDNIPLAFPALTRAEKLQKRCAKVGFDWKSLPPVLSKVYEELEEVQQEINNSPIDQTKLAEELGDLLFASVNLTRHLNHNAEECLYKANLKFEQRFRKIEQKLQQQQKNIEDCSLIELDLLWDKIKQEENAQS